MSDNSSSTSFGKINVIVSENMQNDSIALVTNGDRVTPAKIALFTNGRMVETSYTYEQLIEIRNKIVRSLIERMTK